MSTLTAMAKFGWQITTDGDSGFQRGIMSDTNESTTKSTATKFKVVDVGRPWTPSPPPVDDRHIEMAMELQRKYGLYHLDPHVIATQWHWYSNEMYFAGWISDGPRTVEEVFGVVLEEVKDESVGT